MTSCVRDGAGATQPTSLEGRRDEILAFDKLARVFVEISK